MSKISTYVKQTALVTCLGFASVSIANAETVKVAVDVGYAPHVMAKASGGVEGYNVDLMAALGKEMGIEYEIIDQAWSGIFAGLNSGKFDAIIVPTTITKERAAKLLFSEGYQNVSYQFLLKRGNPQIAKLEDLRGKVISVNKGNYFDKWVSARSEKYGWEVLRFGKNSEAILAVTTGRAYASIAGSTVAGWTSKKNPNLVGSKLIVNSGQSAGFVFRTKDKANRKRFEIAIECLKKSGVIAKIHEKWTGNMPAKDSASFKIRVGLGEPGFNGHDASPHGGSCS
jgi:polar amino acid transport system substrate-binding protein